jgi:phage repressor protein C with HTH and peptisase S24 domain
MNEDERPIDRLLRLAKEHGLNQTQLSAELGTTSAAISNWKARGMPAEWHEKAAKILGITVDELLNGGPRTEPSSDLIDLETHPDLVSVRRVELKLKAGVSGFGVQPTDTSVPPIFFRADWLQSKGYKPYKLVALKVSGQSMEPSLYQDDMVVINTDDVTPRDGKVYAVNYEGEAVIKRLIRDGGTWWLSSDNPDQRRFPRKECSDASCIIVGQVIHRQSEHI